ncbi:hypothetical protein [Yinghuangia sp. YIM S10712]|uniref:hypothetical protein n=1 Tax=Yinghuangia sp. YIM S10712 TaxID=3436930 RepID=UPI003F539B48
MVDSDTGRGRLLTGLCIGLGLLLALEMCAWLLYAFMVGTEHEGYNTNTASALTGPFLGPSTVNGYGVPSRGRDVSERVAVVMAGVDFCAVFGLAVRSVSLRSRAFTTMAVAHTLLLLWALFLSVFDHGYIAFVPWHALIVGYCAAIRRVGPVTDPRSPTAVGPNPRP